MLRTSRIILVVLSLATVLFTYLVFTGVKVDYRYENFFPKGDTEIEYFQKFSKQFGSDNDFLIIGMENKKGIFHRDFLQNVNALADSISRLESVTQVISPTKNLNYFKAGDFGDIQELPYLHFDDESLYRKDSIRIFSNEQLVGTFFSDDRKALSIYVKTKDRLAKKPSDKLLKDLERLFKQFKFDELHAISRIKAQAHFIEVLGSELKLFISASILLLMVVLWFSFRSILGVVLPLITVLVSLVWTLAVMYFTGKDLNVLTSLLPTMVFIVGMSDVVHILTNYIEELRLGKSKEEALKSTIKEVGFATFLTCVSTAIGFFTLMTANIEPVQDFGLYCGIGVIIAYLMSFLLLPSVLLNVRTPKIVLRQGNDIRWQKALRTTLLWTIKYPKRILIIAGVVTILSFVAMFNIKIDNFLLEDLSNDDPVKQDFAYFEDKFGGARPLEVVIELKDSSLNVFDYGVLCKIDSLEKYLAKHYELVNITSPLTFIKEANKAQHSASQKFYVLPDSPEKYLSLKEKLELFGAFDKTADILKNYLSKDGRSIRISGKMLDLGGHRMIELNKGFYAYSAKVIDSKKMNVHLTGTAHLLDLNNESLSKNMIYGLWLSVGFIALIVGWQFRSIKMVIICIIPNIIPGFVVAGFMGIADIHLRVSTSIIFSIAFGIAVDDTIHIMSRLKQEMNKGKSFFYALKRTYLSTGKAVVVTSVILSCGFLTLLLSDFTSSFYVGLLVGLTLLIAIICEMLLLPVLLIYFFKDRGKD